jgi:hypothetical protein
MQQGHRCRFVILFLFLGIIGLPLRAVAATVPALIAYDGAVPRTATTQTGAGPSVRPKWGGVPDYAYDVSRSPRTSSG